MFVRLIAILLVTLGASGFFLPFWIGAVVTDLDELELPLTEAADVAVSADGELFFALTFLGRIQKYSASGDFIRGIDVDSDGGNFCLALTEAELTVYVARRDAADRYDLSGNVIRQGILIDEYAYAKSCARDERVDSIDYGVEQVSVSLKDSDAPITIRRKLWHFLAPGPFVSWLMFAVGLFLIPEWRHSVFAAFAERKTSSTAAKPRGWLRLIDSVLNIFFTLYALAIASIGLLITLVATNFDDSRSIAFSAVFGLALASFTAFGIYKLWTSYDDRVRLAPGISFGVGPAGAVAWKAFALFLLAAFIFSVFHFGEKWAEESGYYDELPSPSQQSDE